MSCVPSQRHTPSVPTAFEPSSLAGRLELRLDQSAPPGNVIPALARLLRRLRDRKRVAESGKVNVSSSS